MRIQRPLKLLKAVEVRVENYRKVIMKRPSPERNQMVQRSPPQERNLSPAMILSLRPTSLVLQAM